MLIRESQDILDDSPLLSAIKKLPANFGSIDEAAQYMQTNKVPIAEMSPIHFGGYTFSYAICTVRSYIYFGHEDSNPQKIVVGKFSRFDLLPAGLEGEVRVKYIQRGIRENAQEESVLKTLRNCPYTATISKSIPLNCEEIDEPHHLLILDFDAPGISLLDFMKSMNDATIDEKADFAAAVGIQIAAGITEMHEANLIHRDVKPGNVMLRRPDTEKGFAVLTDFNSATTSEEIKAQYLTVSPWTSAPELLKTDDAWVSVRSERCDFYSLGATMFYIITGECPYAGDTAWDVLTSIATNRNSPRKKLEEAGVPEQLRIIITKLLEIDPSNRHKKTQDSIGDLKAFLENSAYASLCGEVML